VKVDDRPLISFRFPSLSLAPPMFDPPSGGCNESSAEMDLLSCLLACASKWGTAGLCASSPVGDWDASKAVLFHECCKSRLFPDLFRTYPEPMYDCIL
jgi:hypothetical protein